MRPIIALPEATSVLFCTPCKQTPSVKAYLHGRTHNIGECTLAITGIFDHRLMCFDDMHNIHATYIY